MRLQTARRSIAALVCAASAGASCAAELQVAVAANFAEAAKRIAQEYERDSHDAVKLSFGATGTFYAQIEAGAPFDVLLAADEATPKKLVDEGKGVDATRKTYAIGKLVLWSSDADLVDAQGDVLKTDKFKHLAVADPKLAPYGLAAQQALEHLGLAQTLAPRLVTAGNIGQAFQFVQSGNAELGFVALGQLQAPGQAKPPGSMWLVPDALYSPIRQDCVVVAASKSRAAATAFADYLASDKARAVIKSYGYAW